MLMFISSVGGYFITQRIYGNDSALISHSIIIVKLLHIKPENEIIKCTVYNKNHCDIN